MLDYIKNYIVTFRYIKLISYICAKYLQQSRQECHKHRYTYYYGFQIIYGAINKGMLLILLGLLFNILPQLLLVTLSFSSLRVFAGGLHFDSYTKCAYISLFSFVTMALFSKYCNINAIDTLLIFTIVFVLVIKYAPVEHKNRPFKNNEKAKFKTISIVVLLLLYLTTLTTDNIIIRNSVTYGVLLAGIITTTIINKLK